MKTENKKLEQKHSRMGVSLFGLLISVFGILSTGWVQAQSLSLDSVLKVIERENPMLQTYRNRANAMHAYVAGSRSIMAPEVGGGLWMFPYQKQDYGMMEDTRQVMVSVSQTFTNPAKLKANHEYMASRADIEHANERVLYNQLRAQAKGAYYTWIVLAQKKKQLVESEEILNLMLKVARVRYPYNQEKLANIYKAEGRLYEIKNMQLMNDNGIEQQRNLLLQLMNSAPATNLEIDTVVSPFNPVLVDTTLLSVNRSDLMQLDRTIHSMRLNQALEKAQTRPDFNINFSHMISVGQGMPNQFMLLGMVTIPIAPWSSKMYKANAKAMDYEIGSMKTERVAIMNEVQGMTTRMLSEINTLKKQLDNYEQRIMPALQKNYETVMLAYEENKEELPMVIDGWEALNMTRLQYLDTKLKYYEMIVSYEKEIEK
ncbi:MAG TPA: TolC family protein [Cyclobacteriaceae bacterium]|nr:TolC family protein [Cyclobacteriaceae bacterium]HNU40996.1 TolC family protein [Cyclobacteriaceae bacterium]